MRQGMQTIHRRSKGLLEFVENYRKLTRLPAPVRRPVSIRELLQDLKKLFSEEYIHIELPETDRTLQIDRIQIEQVLINLIKNAKEACSKKEEPLIEIRMVPAFLGSVLSPSGIMVEESCLRYRIKYSSRFLQRKLPVPVSGSASASK